MRSPEHEFPLADFHRRLLVAAGDRSYRGLGAITRTHPETVRRYMQGQSPSVEFIIGFCTAFGIRMDWLLIGEGPMLARDAKEHTLNSATPAELLGALATQLETTQNRVARLEAALRHRDEAAGMGRTDDQPSTLGAAPRDGEESPGSKLREVCLAPDGANSTSGDAMVREVEEAESTR